MAQTVAPRRCRRNPTIQNTNDEKNMNVAIGNDGSGLHHAPPPEGGFGNLLIEMLVQELRGRLTWFDLDPGTGAEIVMPWIPDPKEAQF